MSKIKKIVKNNIDRALSSLYKDVRDMQIELSLINDNQSKLIRSLQLQNSDLEQQKNKGIIQISPNQILVKIFNGLKIYLDTRDIAVVPHIALDGIWEPEITKAWMSLVGENDTVLDIGANFGYFGLLAAQKTDKKNSRIIFFEANPNLIPYIKKTLSLNWYNEQSTVVNAAVSGTEGHVILNVLKNYIGSSSVQPMEMLDEYLGGKMQIELSESIEVPSIRVDDFCKRSKIQKVDLIKMDIEGYEENAYEGMRTIVKNSQKVTLFIEFTKESYKNPEKFYNTMLQDFGSVYSINQDGSLKKIKKTDYKSVIGDAEDWAMPVFSKRDNLESLSLK